MTAWANGIHIIDRSSELLESDPLYAFALDELLCKEAHASGASFCHIWRHPSAFIIGQRDSRLPYAAEAMEWLQENGVVPAIRNSGGAAVPLDLGVVNLSLIFPKELSHHSHFHEDFERMYTLIRHALAFTGLSIEKGEIPGAFCPGDYDLSIAGQKFCGIAQRRQLHAYSVQAFIIASGSGVEKTQFVKDFYELAARDASITDFPQVVNGSTASLEELAQPQLGDEATAAFINAIKQTLSQYRAKRPAKAEYTPLMLPEPAAVRALAQKLRERYKIHNN